MNASSSLLDQIAHQLAPAVTPLSLPPLAPTEVKNELETFFQITSDEAGLISDVLNFYHLNTLDFSFYELMGFDLYNQIDQIESLIGSENCSKIKVSFQTLWYKLLQENDKNPQELMTFLKKLTTELIRLKDSINKLKEPLQTDTLNFKSFQERKKSECLSIIKIFQPKTNLFIKLLGEGCQVERVFYTPINKVFQIDVKANSKNTNLFFKNLDHITKFFCECATLEDPSLSDDCSQLLKDVSSSINSFVSGVNINTKACECLKQSIQNFTGQLRNRANYFQKVLLRVESCCQEYLNILIHKMVANSQPQSLLHVLSGSTKALSPQNPHESDDILISLKRAGLVDSSFIFLKEEENLLKSLFDEYPLDSKVTLFDLLSFALFERIGALDSIIPIANQTELNRIRNSLGAKTYYLFFGFIRSSPKSLSSLGPETTEDAERVHVTPERFIKVLKVLIEDLEIELIPPPKSQKMVPLTEKNIIRLKEEINKTILPLQNLWIKILRSKQSRALLFQSLIKFGGTKKLDKENPKAFDVFLKFLNFHQMIYQFVVRERLFPVHYSIGILPKLTKRTNRLDFEKFARGIAFLVSKFSSLKKDRVELFNDALKGKVTNEEFNKIYVSETSERSETHIQEMIHGDLASIVNSLRLLAHYLRLAEKLVLPKIFSTESSCSRFLHNFYFCSKQRNNQDFPLIEKILFPLIDYFKSNSFKEIIFYIGAQGFKLAFDYGKLLELLDPLDEDLEFHLTSTLTSLKHLPSQLKEHLYSLPLDQLLAIKADEIREQLFKGGVRLLQPIQILMDCLTIIQIRRFYEEAAIIPPELANIMDLDCIEELLQGAIQSKTPPEISAKPMPEFLKPQKIEEVPVMIAMPQPAAQVAPNLQNEDKKITFSKKTSKTKKMMPGNQKESLIEPVKKAISEPVNEIYEEIVDLTKSRKILQKLEEMGYVTARQNGSHVILKNEEGNTVVVPKNDNLPKGTRQSIAGQVFQDPKWL